MTWRRSSARARFYKHTETLTGTKQQAWALGGFGGLRSPWFGDLVQFGVVGWTSQRLYGPAGEGGTLILTQTQGSITVLGEAFGRCGLRVRRSRHTASSSTDRS